MSNPNRTPIWGQYINPDTGEIVNIITSSCKISVEIQDGYKAISNEVFANQDNVEIIPSPGPGKRVVIRYGSIRSITASGKAYFSGVIDSEEHIMGMVYFAKTYAFTGSNVYVRLDENTNLRITTTQGNLDLFYYVLYIIEGC